MEANIFKDVVLLKVIILDFLMPKLCEFQNCRNRASYGNIRNVPIRCKEHKENMELVSMICAHEGCKKRPHFNLPGQTKGLYCTQHKKEGMINVVNKKCLEEGCMVEPCFNLPGQKKGLYCSTHKKEGMICVTVKTCAHEGCKTIPNFNLPGQTKSLYCSEHKKEGMIRVTVKTCLHEGCMVQPNFNLLGQTKGLYCFNHKKEDMIDVKHNFCKAVETGEQPLCQQRGNPKYKGYCTHCFANLFPKDPLTFQIRSKTKEIAVRDFINANFEGFLHDKPMYTAHCDCSIRRRIDHRKLIGNTIFAIETDENQHKSYDKMDEETRYDDLFCAFSGKWVYIRFNPDKYVNKKGERKNPMISTRLFKLKEEMEKQIKRIEKEENTELIERIYMYYDKYD